MNIFAQAKMVGPIIAEGRIVIPANQRLHGSCGPFSVSFVNQGAQNGFLRPIVPCCEENGLERSPALRPSFRNLSLHNPCARRESRSEGRKRRPGKAVSRVGGLVELRRTGFPARLFALRMAGTMHAREILLYFRRLV